ncbi:hypothetical protein APHAL10511_002732 [Amanita phalloides]|nr:hypothetical protein APHAL10511_002732 [Amanita phalloides]
MASRAARAVFSAAVRVTARPTRVVHHIGRRYNSTSSHGSSATSSDTPWIIGSALVFGPALLYLLSPSARKNTAAHAVHDGDHGHESTADAPAPAHTEVKMKDDEGTEQNVTESLAVAEHEDVPKVGEAIQQEKGTAIPDVTVTPGKENVKEQIEEGVKSEPDITPGESGGKEGLAEIGGEEGPDLPLEVASPATKEEKIPKTE